MGDHDESGDAAKDAPAGPDTGPAPGSSPEAKAGAPVQAGAKTEAPDEKKDAPARVEAPAADQKKTASEPDDAPAKAEAPAADLKKTASEPDAADAAGTEGAGTGAPADEPRSKEGKKKKRKKDQASVAPAEPPAAEPTAAEPTAADMAPAGSPWEHRIRGGIVFTIGAVLTFLLMASAEQWPHGAAIGMLTTALCVVGLLDALGLLAGSSRPASELSRATDLRATSLWPLEGEPVFFAPIVTVPAAIAVFGLGALLGGVDGLPRTILIALAVLGPSAIRRPAWIVFLVGSAIILPFLGVYGLWDPWETHYGEVAREILSRDDWISLWWAQEDWFWSKPIFIFWIESLSMSALGVDFHPDANPAHPEWAIRLPHYLLSIGALLSVYAMLRRPFGRRAGVVAALVLGTMPHFFFLSHQAITDMPFVSTMTIAMAMFCMALVEPGDREVRWVRAGPLAISGQTALLGALAMVCLPQILLLCTRNVTLFREGFSWHADTFFFGSAGNAGNPGNSPWRQQPPAFDGPLAQPLAQGLLWLLAFAFVAWAVRRERRTRSLYMFGFYLFCAFSFMAKGIPGFALPGLVALLWLVTTRRWEVLLEGRLRVAVGIVIVLAVGMPWYVAMYVRHGQGFTDRLLVHDHLNRLAAGVHGDTGSIEYFLEQLGYGLFPWVALMPLAIAAWVVLGRRSSAVVAPEGGPTYREAPPTRAAVDPAQSEDARRDVLVVLGLWGTSAFVLFSAMATKFHHYIFPAVPACGALVGIAFDRLLGPASDLERPTVRGVLGTVLAVLAPVGLVVGVAALWGDVRGVVPESVAESARADWVLRHPWLVRDAVLWLGLGLGLGAAAFHLLRSGSPPATSWGKAAATSGLFAAPAIVALVGRDLSWVTSARPAGYERLIHLFVYNYGRAWPTHFDYRPVLTGFAIVSGSLIGLAAIPILRQVALRAFLGTAIAFAMWCLDVYIVDLSPHWGQRELLQRYYAERRGPEEPILAWQMNWKGENFYSGNRVFTFVDLDNRRLTDWVQAHQGHRVYFLLEHSRLPSLQGVLRGSRVEEVTDERIDNKFQLVRADLAAPAPPPQPPRLPLPGASPAAPTPPPGAALSPGPLTPPAMPSAPLSPRPGAGSAPMPPAMPSAPLSPRPGAGSAPMPPVTPGTAPLSAPVAPGAAPLSPAQPGR